MSEPLACVICGVVPEPAFTSDIGDTGPAQPAYAVICIAYGQYGSTVWDPPSGRTFLQFNICDPCLVAAGQQGRVVQVSKTVIPKHTYDRWEGGDST